MRLPAALRGSRHRPRSPPRGLAIELRRAATGLVLQPRHASEGDLLGVALPRLHAPPPGRGVLVDRGRTLVVQVALPRAPADRGTIVG